jgi:beta-lactamase superfamily II metal-dependent hydrolase
MFRIDLMPAQQGDCLWIEYGDPRHPHRILVDGGTPATYRTLKRRIESLPEKDRRFELVVITHIDSDHIGGIMKLLKEPPAGLQIGDVWFNGLRHLPRPDKTLSVRQAEEVVKELKTRKFPWNAEFGGARICMNTSGPLPKIRLRDGMFLTLLSPYLTQLRNLQPKWQHEVEELKKKEREAGRRSKPGTLALLPDVTALADSPFEPDDAEANGSSIALLAECEGKSLLLGADAFATVLDESIRRLLAETGKERLPLEAFKVSHHGSDANTSTTLLGLLDCKNYLISTDGSMYGHPDAGAMSRMLAYGGETKTLHFNYGTARTLVWDNDDLRFHHRFETRYPAGAAGISLVLNHA